MLFTDKRWPLHSALTWILTRDKELTETTSPNSPNPINALPWPPTDDASIAWRALHADIASGNVAAYGSASRQSELESMLDPAEVKLLEWADPNEFSSRDHAVGLRNPKLRRFNENLPATVRYGVVFEKVRVDSADLLEYYPAEEQPTGYTSAEYGAPISPEGSGFMSLTSAAYWIATEGGSKGFLLRDHRVWTATFRELLNEVAVGNVDVIGRSRGALYPEKLSNLILLSATILFPTDEPQEIFFSSGPLILRCSFPQTAAESPSFKQHRMGDCLFSGDTRRGDIKFSDDCSFSDLAVSKSEIALIWQRFGESKAPRVPTKVTPDKRLLAFYLDWIKTKEREGRTPSFDEDWAQVRSEFGKGVTKARIKILRRTKAPAHWKVGGRPRKSTNS